MNKITDPKFIIQVREYETQLKEQKRFWLYKNDKDVKKEIDSEIKLCKDTIKSWEALFK